MIAGIAFCLTVMGIPFGVASSELAAAELFPLGERVVGTARPGDRLRAGGGVVGGAHPRHDGAW